MKLVLDRIDDRLILEANGRSISINRCTDDMISVHVRDAGDRSDRPILASAFIYSGDHNRHVLVGKNNEEKN